MSSRRWLSGRARRAILGIGNFSTGNYYATANDGGEAGLSSGFGSVGIITLEQLGISRYIFSHAAGSGSPGHMFWLNAADQLVFLCGSGVPAVVSSPGVQLRGSDVGKLLIIIGWHTGTQLRCAVSTLLTGQPGTAITGYTPFTGAPSVISGYASPPGSSSPALAMRYHAHLTFRGTPTDAQLQALIDQARTVGFGSLPSSFTGATVTHRWSVRDVLSGSSPVDGQAAPATLPDTITAASIDTMTRSGTGTTVKITDSRIGGRKTYGAMGFSLTNYLEAASLSRTAATGYWFALWAIPWVITTNGQTYKWLLDFGATGKACGIRAETGSTLVIQGSNVNAASFSLTAGHVGNPMLITGTMSGSTFEGYVNGVSTGAAVAATDAGAASILRLGENLPGTAFGQDWSLLGYTMGRVVGGISAGEALAHYQACVAAGRMVPIAGKTEHHIDLTADVIANGGPDSGFPTTVRDRIGTDHLTRQGGLIAVNGGLTGFGASGYPQGLSAASGLPGLATGLWVSGLITAPPTGLLQAIFSNTGAGPNGLLLRLASNNVVTGIFGDGTATTTVFSTGALTPGVTYHVLAHYDGSVARIYVNGVAGTASAAFVLAPGSLPVKLGTAYAGTSDPAPSLIIRGVSGGHTPPSAGEISAASTYALANGKLGGIAGKTLRLYSLVDDIIDAGGKSPVMIKDRVSNTEHLPIIGAGLQVAQRTERVYGWEAA